MKRAGEIAAFGLRMNAGWPFEARSLTITEIWPVRFWGREASIRFLPAPREI